MSLTYFEIFFLASLLCFRDEKPDYVILEVGIGAKDDVTNLLKNKEMAVFTKISEDHIPQLGDDILEIAENKSYLITNESINISAKQDFDVKTLLTKKAVKPISFLDDNSHIPYPDTNENIENFRVENIRLSLLIAEKLHLHYDTETIQKLLNLKIPGRFQIIHEKPRVVIDMAHNKDALRSLFSNFKKPVYVIFRADEKKDVEFVLHEIKDKIKDIIIVDYDKLTDKCLYNFRHKAFNDAMDEFLEKSNKNDTIVVCGSAYFLHLAIEYWRKHV